MSDIDRAVRASKQLEGALQQWYGASGKGLHEKLSSVEGQLPAHLVKRMRYIATIRNKLLHDADYRRMDDRRAFKQAVSSAHRELRRLQGKRSGGRRWLWLLVVLALAAIGIGCYLGGWRCLS